MKGLIIARRYADGYLDHCRATIGVRAGLEQLLLYKETAERAPELRQFLESGVIGHEEKRAFIAGVLRKAFAAEFCGLVELLLEKRRIDRLGEIAEYAVSAYLHEERHVMLETANMMDIGQLKRLKAALEKRLGGAVRVYVNFNADLIAGFRAAVGNTVIDGSLSRCLAELKDKLVNVKVGQ